MEDTAHGATTPEEEAAFAASRADREGTLSAMHGLEVAAGTAAPGREDDWLDEVIGDSVERFVHPDDGAVDRPLLVRRGERLAITGEVTGMLAKVRECVGADYPLIGVGGVFTADDVRAKMSAGASLVQVYTSFVYEGPMLAKRLARA